MGVERYGSKTDVVVKLVLVFFISLLSFSIGTFVGKKFSDSQHKLALLEPGASEHAEGHSESTEERGVASVNPDSHDAVPNKALSDEEIAKLAEEFVTDDAEAAPHAPAEIAKHGEKAAHSEKADHKKEPAHDAKPSAAVDSHGTTKAENTHAAGKADHAAPMKAAARLADGKAPSEHSKAVAQEAPSRIPASLPREVAASAIGKYTIQIASYPDESEAQKLAASLKSKKLEAFYVPAKVKGKTFYRVNIGLYSSSKEAKTDVEKVSKLTNVSTPLIQKIASE
jgi:septal ring-binding cell division protein DamX